MTTNPGLKGGMIKQCLPDFSMRSKLDDGRLVVRWNRPWFVWLDYITIAATAAVGGRSRFS